MYRFIVVLLAVSTILDAEDFFRDNDRVVLVGNTFIERAQSFGHLESGMLLSSRAKNLVFRNLGWSGDSIFNDSRSYFGPPQEGRERLAKGISELNPTVVFLCYGTGEAMSVDQKWTDEKGAIAAPSGVGLEAELEVFLRGYRHLIKSVREAAGDSLREIVLVTPPPLENLGAPLLDQVENNGNLEAFSRAIIALAEEEGIRSLDLFSRIGHSDQVASPALTENGVHYGDAGYRMITRHWVEGLGLQPDFPDSAKLREAVVDKNRLFFHRWRPANETYLFLFRKHEQGNNAKEIPMFDPLIEKKEKEIEKLRRELRTPEKPV